MADKKLLFKSGINALRPITNSQCVMAQGLGSLDRYLNGEKPVLMPTLMQGNISTSNSRYSSSAASGMTTSVVMKNPMLIPYAGVKFNVHIDPELEGLKIKIYHGYNEGITSSTSNVSKYTSSDLADGDSFKFPVNYYGIETGSWDQASRYYRIAFFSSTLTLSANDIKEAIRLGYLAITYEDETGSVIARNQRATEVIEASKSSINPSKHHNFVFTHISDLHGDGIALYNALKFSKAINSQGLFITGDVVVQSSYDGYDYVHEMCKEFEFPSFLTTGNHDGVGISSLATFNNSFFSDMANTFEYTKGSSEVGYYYKDLSDPKIRIIVLDCSDTSASYRIHCVSSTQINWLTSILNSTPAGYGVIIALHQPLAKPTAASIAANPSFAADANRLGTNSVNSITWTGSSDIRNAVDNFIENGGEFIMYAIGHMHSDIAGIIEGTSHIQLQAIVGSPNRMMDMQDDTIALGDGIGKARDVINAYIIDRKRKTVRVVRAGANITEDLTERLVEEFSYA